MSLPLLPKSFPAGYIAGTEHFYTLAQIRDYGQQCRAAALEEAATMCESLACTDDHDSTITRLECAEKIRSLK